MAVKIIVGAVKSGGERYTAGSILQGLSQADEDYLIKSGVCEAVVEAETVIGNVKTGTKEDVPPVNEAPPTEDSDNEDGSDDDSEAENVEDTQVTLDPNDVIVQPEPTKTVKTIKKG
jgi:hypothetical protein